MNDVGVIADGAVSRPSIVVTLLSDVRWMTMKPPPPIPHENGSATPRTPAAVTAASTAFPPRFSASIAACVASVSTLAAAPPVPVEVGGPDGATAAAATPVSTRNEERSAATTRNLLMLSPFRLGSRNLHHRCRSDVAPLHVLARSTAGPMIR